jgi:adenine phosphoribosyltransferase
MNVIIPYDGQKYHKIELFGLVRHLPIINVREGLWIASNADLILGDIEFISKASKAIVEKLDSLSIDVIVSPEAKSIALAFNVGRLLGLNRIVIARKSIKSYMHDYVVENLSSITTKEEQVLILTRRDIEFLRDKSVCILDDVVSTGGTITALENLISRSGPKKIYKVVIWKEGPWYKSKDLIYFDILPIYVHPKFLNRFRGVVEND